MANKNETSTQRKRRLEKAREKYKAKRAKMSENDKNTQLQKVRESLASQTPEKRETRLAKKRERFRNYVASQTPEQREARLVDLRQRSSIYVASQTPEQREATLAKSRQRFSDYIASQTPEQREATLAESRQRFSDYIASQTPEQREARLAQSRQRSSDYVASQTPEQRETRLSTERERFRDRIESETPTQREARLALGRERFRERTASETPEQRETRLINLRQNSAQWRALLPLSRYVEEFEKAINVVCDRICEICMKRCYPNQIHAVQYRPVALSYLPTELSVKTSLLLCSRCQSHVTSNKTTSPAKAFWNNLDPGPVPEVLQALTQAEQRLLCRVIPFVKIVKFSGLFGQYGFRGQAVLFAQDIFEVSEQLPTMLPKSTSQAGIVVLTEHLENLNITREYTISRDRVYAALRWLVANNPLYRDVQVDETVQINEQDIIRVTDTSRTSDPHEEINAFVPINDVAKIIRASWHQGDASIFTTGYAGMQCSAISMANILRAKILDPSRWSANTLNSNMLEGDALYCKIRALLQPHEIDETGHLEIRNFHVVRSNIRMYDALFTVHYEDDTTLFGSLQDNINANSIGITLMEALTQLFETHISGILTAAQKSLGVMYSDHKYYFTDSHSCGPKGTPVASNGRACVIQCETVRELCRICKRCLGSRNIPYTLTYVDVHCTQEVNPATQHLLPEPLGAPSSQPPPPVSEILIAVQTSVMLPVDSVQPDVEDELEVSERVNEIRRKTSDNIVNEAHELKAEEFAWYHLFPRGENGLKQGRPVHITPLDYYQFRILGEDSRFQRNDYLFYALSMFEYYRVKSTIAACARKVEGEHGTKVEDLHLYLKNLRGSAAYWRSALSDLIAQIRCLGPPNYFLTLSCNDLYWTDMRKVLVMADGRVDANPEDLDVNATQRLIEMYPVAVSRHFMVRVNALMRFLKLDASIFGSTIKDFWWRIEFQNRGSPHLHMVVWVEDHPPIDTPEGIARIDAICTTSSAPEDTELRGLVQKCQLHHHTATCTKNNTTNTCRFNFPHKECSETHIIDPSSDDFVRSGGRICVLKRELVDRWVNNYNPNLLKMWKANMDIQPCGTNESIAYYIAKYVAKSEPTSLDGEITRAIQQIRTEETDVSRRLFKICMRILKERQVSACECVFRLCHLNMRDSSRKAVFLNTRKPEQRYKVLKFGEAGQVTGYCANMFDRYEKRPTEHPDYDFCTMSLIEFAMLFEPYYTKPQQNTEENIDQDAYIPAGQVTRRQLITLVDNSKMSIRNTPAVIRVPNFVASTDPEAFYYSLLLQYMPYRRESELIGEHNSAREAFLAREDQLRATSAHMELYRERDRQLENAFNQVHAFQLLEQAEPIQPDEEDEVPHLPMDENQFQLAQRAMNAGQRDIFKMITESIGAQMSGDGERLRIFFTGGAGVGKTFLLNLLRNQINRCYAKDAVKVCALTGVAARLISGSTIHSMLKLPVQKDGRATGMSPLTGNYLRIMRQQWRQTEFLIIDEISMVSYQMLCMIDSRLRQIKNNDENFFGGVNVLLFGDLLQLPPIKRSGTPIYKQPEYLQPATHLWRLFTLCELTENMRQQGDHAFIGVLNALRIGEMASEHFSILMGRVLQEAVGEFAIEKALRVYPTNQQVHDHNTAVLNSFRSQNVRIYRIRAQDQLIDATRNVDNINLADVIPGDVNKTGGLPQELEIFAGAKVMLRANVDVTKGLVNGAIGYIKEIVWPHFRRTQMYETDIPSVYIDFERDGVHLIHPKAIQFPAKYNYGTAERRMLPIILSWASTVHKMQGSTVDHAVVYLGPRLFEEGQAYVALSRVRSLEGLRIEQLDCDKLTGKRPCNKDAMAELERMRSLRN